MKIQEHTELEVYKKAFDAAMSIFLATKKFPKDEMYLLTDQIRRSSRSVCANLAEAWRKRRYKAAFIAKLSDAKPKPLKPRYGFNLQFRVVTSELMMVTPYVERTTKLCECWSL
jgi:hypothetical protein